MNLPPCEGGEGASAGRWNMAVPGDKSAGGAAVDGRPLPQRCSSWLRCSMVSGSPDLSLLAIR